MSLSKENFDKIVKTGLYSFGPDIQKYVHCRNNTYKPAIRDDKIYMLDSYWTNDWESLIEVTDDNIDRWVLLLDYEAYHRRHCDSCEEYNEEDYIEVADDSGGWSFPKCYLKNTAKPNKEYKLKILKYKKKELEDSLEFTDTQIKKLEEEMK